MSLKARLRIAIVALVTLVVIGMSALYLYDFTRMTFRAASERAGLVADEVKGNLVDRLDRETTARGLHPGSLPEWKITWARIISTDPSIAEMLKRTLASADLVVAILVTDEKGQVLAASSPDLVHTMQKPAEDFRDLQARNWLVNLWDLMTRRQDYTTTRPLGVEPSKEPFFNITVVIRSVLLKHAVQPALQVLALTFGSALFISIFLGTVLPSVILDPLQRVSRNIDLIRTGEFDTATLTKPRESSEFAAVQSKLNLLGQQFRGAKQDALELRSNVEQLLERLEEAVLLFDNNGRLMMAGETAERMLGKSRDQLIGHSLEELFPASTVLGNVIVNAVRMRESVHNQAVTIPPEAGGALHLMVSVEILRRSEENIGTLITLRDVESRRQLEVQLGISSRLAAISRLTSGVAHEIKNPLNAMALHLEVLKSKLEVQEPELDVISGEIKRLDNVVKTFLNFNKPVVLQARPIDLNRIVEQVLVLVRVEAQARKIEMESTLTGKLWINGDPDLLKQAILNVVNNGLEAMKDGGKLGVRTEWGGDECQLTIRDAGPGIAPEIQDRIFNLYFTTKQQGTGIGLATTFRVVQLHSGTIDFVSEQGKGTTFRLRFPGMMDYQGEALTSATGIS
ncbi:MAG TPA: ATP-binding protein [Bryobacteraceae bacterium]|nr:ATP-binding protein [Bryobacteraceae bacterium]